jgi:hypothetical protein
MTSYSRHIPDTTCTTCHLGDFFSLTIVKHLRKFVRYFALFISLAAKVNAADVSHSDFYLFRFSQKLGVHTVTNFF